MSVHAAGNLTNPSESQSNTQQGYLAATRLLAASQISGYAQSLDARLLSGQPSLKSQAKSYQLRTDRKSGR